MTQVKRVRRIRPNASAISCRFLVAVLSSDESLLGVRIWVNSSEMPILVVKNTAKLIAGTLARLYNTCVINRKCHEHKVVHSQKTG